MRDLKSAIADELRAAHAKGEIRVVKNCGEDSPSMLAEHSDPHRQLDLCLDQVAGGADEPVKNVPPATETFLTTGMLFQGSARELFRPPEDNVRITDAYWRAMIIFGLRGAIYVVGLSRLSP